MKHINRRIMQYQVIVLDLDGTLTNSKKEITEPTRQALIDIQKNGKTVVLGIRPEDIHDEQLFIESSPESVIDARINIYEMLGAEVYLYFTIDQFDITARVNARTTARPGDTVQFAFDLSKIHIFDKETEEILVN